MHSDTESCVRAYGEVSDFFEISSGVRQGCPAAPDLFSCLIDYLMTQVNNCIPGVCLNGHPLKDLEHADDTTLFASNLGDSRFPDSLLRGGIQNRTESQL